MTGLRTQIEKHGHHYQAWLYRGTWPMAVSKHFTLCTARRGAAKLVARYERRQRREARDKVRRADFTVIERRDA